MTLLFDYSLIMLQCRAVTNIISISMVIIVYVTLLIISIVNFLMWIICRLGEWLFLTLTHYFVAFVRSFSNNIFRSTITVDIQIHVSPFMFTQFSQFTLSSDSIFFVSVLY